MNILQPEAFQLTDKNMIRGEHVSVYKKLLKETNGLFADTSAADPEMLLYTVYSYETGDPEKAGHLYWGLTVMESVTINGECNMTRGHFHTDRNCAEFYFGIAGTGLLMLMDETGKTWAEKVSKGSLHHIDGHIAHRLINTGTEPLNVGACWPTTAGHDYAAIEKRPFPCRVFK